MKFRLKRAVPKEEWVLAGVFINPQEAYLRQSLLEDAHIPTVILDENMAGLLPGFSVRLMVPKRFLPEVKNLWQE